MLRIQKGCDVLLQRRNMDALPRVGEEIILNETDYEVTRVIWNFDDLNNFRNPNQLICVKEA